MDTIPHFVYELVDPRDNSIFYVGITIELYARYRQHMRCEGINAEKDTRIQEIVASGYLPVMRRLECVDNLEHALDRERYWIKHYTDLGVHLLNAVVTQIKRQNIREKRTVMIANSPANASSGDSIGRRSNFPDMIDMLMQVRETRQWPESVSTGMRRYYRRHYPEFFKNGKRWEKIREDHAQRAIEIRAENVRRGRQA